VPFAQIPKKLKEHYGIEVQVSSARQITARHGETIWKSQSLQTEIPHRPGVGTAVAQMDGCMIPVVSPAEPTPAQSIERRKTRQLDWWEAHLALAPPAGSVTPFFAATLGGPEEAGAQWAGCVIGAGAGTQTQIHYVGGGPLGLSSRWSCVLESRHVIGSTLVI
jgi:hypothetical protein